MSYFESIEIGRSALRTQQRGMEVTGQNVANATTPGYTRQRTELEAVHRAVVAENRLAPGRGVKITQIIRVRSEFYFNQLINVESSHIYWKSRNEALLAVESIFGEPGEYSINAYLNEFFDLFNELNANPESSAIRMSLREQAYTFTKSVQDGYMRLHDLFVEYRDQLHIRVKEINELAELIANLNKKIQFSTNLGQVSNELLDKRDLALEELSQLINIRVYNKEAGAVEVFAGGRLLVQNQFFFPVQVERSQGDGSFRVVTERGYQLKITGGELRGLLDSLNIVIPRTQDEINRIIHTFADAVNNLHYNGFGLDSDVVQGEDVGTGDGAANVFNLAHGNIAAGGYTVYVDGIAQTEGTDYTLDLTTGEIVFVAAPAAGAAITADYSYGSSRNFFRPIDATLEDIPPALQFFVEDAILDDPSAIAASSVAGKEGNGLVALEISKLRGVPLIDGTTTLSDYYRGMITSLAVEGEESERMYEGFMAVANELRLSHESVAGVNLDDEMVNIMQFTHAWNAAAQFISAIDEMMAFLIYQLGVK